MLASIFGNSRIFEAKTYSNTTKPPKHNHVKICDFIEHAECVGKSFSMKGEEKSGNYVTL